MEFLSANPQGLRRSLARWLKALNETGTISSRTINNMLFCQRGVRISEFIGLFGASSLSGAVELALQFSTNESDEEMEDHRSEVKKVPEESKENECTKKPNIQKSVLEKKEPQICEEKSEKTTGSKLQNIFAIPRTMQDDATSPLHCEEVSLPYHYTVEKHLYLTVTL